MAEIFAKCRHVLKPDGIMTVMFAHKDTGAWDATTMALDEAGCYKPKAIALGTKEALAAATTCGTKLGDPNVAAMLKRAGRCKAGHLKASADSANRFRRGNRVCSCRGPAEFIPSLARSPRSWIGVLYKAGDPLILSRP